MPSHRRSKIGVSSLNEKRCDQSFQSDNTRKEFGRVTVPTDNYETLQLKNAGASSSFPPLSLVHSGTSEYDESQKWGKYVDAFENVSTTRNSGENDNQTAHLPLKTQETYDIHPASQAKAKTNAKRWASAADAFSPGIDKSLLPHLSGVSNPVIPSPHKLNSRIQKAHFRRTWHGNMRPLEDTKDSGSNHNTFQRRSSGVNATLATFQATETILLAEIDSDERCTNFLRQRAPRGTLSSNSNVDEFSRNEIYYKLRALDRKVLMNKEKLVQVRARIAELGGKPTLLTQEEPDHGSHFTMKPNHVRDAYGHNSSVLRQQLRTPGNTLPKTLSIAMAALVIQCAFRAFQARCGLAKLLGNTYQRVLSPDNNQYFYYNRLTRLSQWEAPRLLRRCRCSLEKPIPAKAKSISNNDEALNAAAKIIQTMIRHRALKVFLHDLKLGNLEKVFDAGFGAWYYFNSRTNCSFWESVYHVRLTASSSAIYHRHPT